MYLCVCACCVCACAPQERALTSLHAALGENATTVVTLQLAVEFERQLPVAGTRKMTYVASSPPLDEAERAAMRLATMLEGGAEPKAAAINVSAMFPKFLRLPSVGSAPTVQPLVGLRDDYWHTMQNLTFVHSVQAGGGNTEQWWGVRQADLDASPFATTPSDGLQVVLAADNLVAGSGLSSLASGGILAVYLTVVVGIGRSIRGVLGGTRYRLQVDEMPDTRDLIDLCEGVYIARREKKLMRETQLSEIVLRLFRSSETLLQLTGSKLKRHGE